MQAFQLTFAFVFLFALSAFQTSAQTLDYWQNLTGDIQQLAVDPNDPDRIFFASADGFIGSTIDGGQSWSSSRLGQQTANDQITGLVALGNDTVLVSVLRDGDNRFYSSTDGAQTWTILSPAQNPLAPAELRALAPGMVQVSNQIVSRDGLQTTDSLEVQGLLWSDGEGGLFRFVASSNFGLVNGMSTYWSGDLGMTWDTIAQAIPFGFQYASNNTPIRVIPRSKQQFAMVFGRDRVVAVTTDGGLTFNLADTDLNRVLDVVWLDDNTLVAYEDYRGASLSTDAGATWVDAPQYTNTDQTLITQTRALTDGRGGILLARRADLYRIPAAGGAATSLRAAMHTNDVDELKCIDSQTAEYFNSNGAIRTVDGGLTWQTVTSGDRDYRLLMGSAEGWWAEGPGRDLYLSTDQGATWTLKADLPTSGFNPLQTMFAAGDTGLVVILASGSVVSYDRGDTWEVRPGGGNSNGLDNAGAATTGSWMQQFGQGNTFDIRITRDSGATFVDAGITANQQRGAGAAAVSARYFATPHFMSEDLGQTWIDLTTTTGWDDVAWREVWFRNPRHGAFHDADGSRGIVTYDGGLTWQEDRTMVPRFIHFRDTSTAMAFDPTRGIFRFEQPVSWPTRVLPAGTVSSIEAFAKTSSLQVYPNPVHRGSSLQITGLEETSRLTLIDPLGRQVFQDIIQDNSVQLPASLPRGTYVLLTDHGTLRLVVK